MANAREQNWIESYENLSNFYEEFGKVPTYKKGNDTEVNKIAKWVQFQKYSYNKGNLSIERVEKLEELTFWKWSTPNAKYDGYVKSEEDETDDQFEKPKRRTTKKKSESEEQVEKPKRRTTKKKAETDEQVEKPKRRTTKKKVETEEQVEKPKRRTTKKKSETEEQAEKPKRKNTKKKVETEEQVEHVEELEAVVVIEHDGIEDEMIPTSNLVEEEKREEVEEEDPITEFEEEKIEDVEKEDPIIDEKLNERVSICLDISNLEEVEEVSTQKNYFTIIDDELEKIEKDLKGIMEKTTKNVVEEEVDNEIIIEKPKKKNNLNRRKGKKAE